MYNSVRICPFCGNTAALRKAPLRRLWFVECEYCGARQRAIFTRPERAAREWNSRAHECPHERPQARAQLSKEQYEKLLRAILGQKKIPESKGKEVIP